MVEFVSQGILINIFVLVNTGILVFFPLSGIFVITKYIPLQFKISDL
jgi:hypothetical protein